MREAETEHQCFCVLAHEGEDVHDPANRCHEIVDSFDAPFCGNCSDRHPEKGPSVTVTIWGVGEPVERNAT